MNEIITTNASSSMINEISNSTQCLQRKLTDEKSSTFYIKEKIKNDKIREPLEEYKSQVYPLEKELFKCINLNWGEDIISEDMPLIEDNNHCNYYLHLFRTANPSPNKENFFLIHGFLSSGLHFLCLIPYLIKRYNIFIPDTIGMGLSSRPKIKFTSPMQCEEYFLNIYHLVIKNIFFKEKFNIKKEYYLCGHSLGGFFASRYLLKYPKGIKKLLLLSPAGITDYRIPGTSMHREASYKMYFLTICCPTLVWPCKLRVQNMYRCCCCHNLIKKYYGTYIFNFDESEIKKNSDGSNFKIDEKKIASILRKLTILSLDYPDDLYECAYYLFGVPPPAAYLPIERNIWEINTKQIIFVFGEKDWMDKIGAYRLNYYNKELYKVFSIHNSGHSFAMENPKELTDIIGQYFED